MFVKFILAVCFWLHYTTATHDGFLINTSKCKIPNLSVFASELVFQRNSTVKCSSYDELWSYTSIKEGKASLQVRRNVFGKYFEKTDSIMCYYSYLYRQGTPDYPDVGVRKTDCVPFDSPLELQHDLVYVACEYLINNQSYAFTNNCPINPIYENIHQVIIPTRMAEEKARRFKETSRKRPLSVLMIIIDSVSRLNFNRTMPLTHEFVMKNGFYDFKGYNKIADNTYPNAMGFLAGMEYEQSIEQCRPRDVDGLINCPFLWNKFSQHNFVTAYAEDWASIATFNYFKKGFVVPPTDYYFKPYFDAVETLPIKWQDTMPFCAGPESQGDRMLNVAYDFATTFKNTPKFGVFWMNTFSHNDISSPMSMDQNVSNFFERLKGAGVMEDNVVVLLSDHGVRFGTSINSTRGYYEVRLPMNYISLPDWFKRQYPYETSVLEDNTGKLTSNYDLYMTLQDLLVYSGVNYTKTHSLGCPGCRSLFERIPNDRSCAEAGIPDYWCTCHVVFNGTEQYLS